MDTTYDLEITKKKILYLLWSYLQIKTETSLSIRHNSTREQKGIINASRAYT